MYVWYLRVLFLSVLGQTWDQQQQQSNL